MLEKNKEEAKKNKESTFNFVRDKFLNLKPVAAFLHFNELLGDSLIENTLGIDFCWLWANIFHASNFVEKKLGDNSFLQYNTKQDFTIDNFMSLEEKGSRYSFFSSRYFQIKLKKALGETKFEDIKEILGKLEVPCLYFINQFKQKLDRNAEIKKGVDKVFRHCMNLPKSPFFRFLLKHMDCFYFLFTQPVDNLICYFDNNKRKKQFLTDVHRNIFLTSGMDQNGNITNSEVLDLLVEYSRFGVLAFFFREWFWNGEIPDSKLIEFCIALISMLGQDDDKKNYLVFLLNAEESELSDKEKEWREKIRTEQKFRDEIINEWKSTFDTDAKGQENYRAYIMLKDFGTKKIDNEPGSIDNQDDEKSIEELERQTRDDFFKELMRNSSGAEINLSDGLTSEKIKKVYGQKETTTEFNKLNQFLEENLKTRETAIKDYFDNKDQYLEAFINFACEENINLSDASKIKIVIEKHGKIKDKKVDIKEIYPNYGGKMVDLYNKHQVPYKFWDPRTKKFAYRDIQIKNGLIGLVILFLFLCSLGLGIYSFILWLQCNSIIFIFLLQCACIFDCIALLIFLYCGLHKAWEIWSTYKQRNNDEPFSNLILCEIWSKYKQQILKPISNNEPKTAKNIQIRNSINSIIENNKNNENNNDIGTSQTNPKPKIKSNLKEEEEIKTN